MSERFRKKTDDADVDDDEEMRAFLFRTRLLLLLCLSLLLLLRQGDDRGSRVEGEKRDKGKGRREVSSRFSREPRRFFFLSGRGCKKNLSCFAFVLFYKEKNHLSLSLALSLSFPPLHAFSLASAPAALPGLMKSPKLAAKEEAACDAKAPSEVFISEEEEEELSC